MSARAALRGSTAFAPIPLLGDHEAMTGPDHIRRFGVAEPSLNMHLIYASGSILEWLLLVAKKVWIKTVQYHDL